MFGPLNETAAIWWEWMLSMFWQVGILIILIGILDLLIRKWAWPQLRYALWLLVLVKLILPPSLTSPTSLTSNLQPLAKDAFESQLTKPHQTETLEVTVQAIPEAPAARLGIDVESMHRIIDPPPSGVGLLSRELLLEDESVIEPQSLVVQTQQAQPVVGENPPVETAALAVAEEPATSEAGTVTPEVKLHWKFYVMLVWSLGIWILTGWFILYWRQLTRQVRKQSTTDTLPDWFFDSLRETAALLGLRRIPKVAVSSKIATPAVFGLFRPTLLMPSANLDTLSRRDGRQVLLHELAHIKRRDPLVHTFNLLLQIVYWFNPLLWLVRKQLQHLRELCCDATVAKILKENTMAYRETLLETAKRLLAKPVKPGLGLLGLFENSNRLVTRLKWLEKKTWKHSRIRFAVIVLVIAAISACILPMAQAGKANDAKETKEAIENNEIGEANKTKGAIANVGAEDTIVLNAENVQVKNKVSMLTADKMNLRAVASDLELPPGRFGSFKALPKSVERSGFGGNISSIPMRLVQLEAKFLRVPTTMISSLKFDRKTGKGEVSTILVDMEKGEVTGSILDAAQIDFLIKSWRSHNEVQVLTAPKIVVYTGETAEIFVGQDRPDSKFGQGLRMQVNPTLDVQDRIRLNLQLSHQKMTQPIKKEEYAQGFYDNRVTMQARLQSGQSLLTALPEDFLTDFHTKQSTTPTQILIILKAEIIKAKQKSIDTPDRTAKSDQSVQNILTDTVVSIGFQEMGFAEVLYHVAKNYNLNLNILWGSLEGDAGITQDDPVTLMLNQVPLQKALESILANVSAGKEKPAKYMIDQGVITIATEEDLQGRFQVQPGEPGIAAAVPEPITLPSTPSPMPSASYQGNRPWKWYVLMEEIRTLQQTKMDMENQLNQIVIERQEFQQTRSKDHPDVIAVEQKIKLYQKQYMVTIQKYEEASRKMQDLEEKIVQAQELSNQLRFLQQQQQQLEQRILDSSIELESAGSVQEQKKAEILLPALRKQQDMLEAKIQRHQEQLETIRRHMN